MLSMTSRIMARWAALCLVCTLMLAGAGPAAAEWRRAESPRFIVYSDGGERALRDYVQKLETFDLILRRRLGLPLGEVPPRKLPIYIVSGHNRLREVVPGLDRDIQGIYIPTEEDIFAIAIRDSNDDILLHEYTHHFMFDHSTVAYPGWLVEGFAEYFSTAEIDADSVQVGGYSDNRAQWLLGARWIGLEDLVSKRPGEVRRGEDRNTYYPVAWLLTHWFMGDPDRNRQLQAYIDDVGAGGDPVEAMQRATGLTMSQLRQALNRYMRERLPARRYEADFPRAEITVTVLPPSADQLLLIGQRLKVGVPEDARAGTAAEVRERAARYPDDPFALLQLGHAELHFGDPAAGEAVLTRLLEREPENVEALQLMATRYLALAREADADPAAIRTARRYLARAFAADDANYNTFILLGQAREGAAGYPNENDVATWEFANALAPQLASARLGYGSALMRSGNSAQAVTVLRPLANAPHGGPASEAALAMIQRAEAGAEPLSDAEIDAAVEADEADPVDPAVPPEAGSATGEEPDPEAGAPPA